MRLRTAEALLSEAGLPPISSEDPPLSFFEFWPFWAFYTPLWPYLLWLMLRYRGITLPCSANPSFALGGLVGESKAQILEWLEKHLGPWVAPSISRMRSLEPVARQVAQAQQALSDKGLALPVVAKPDLGCRGAGVRLVRTPDQLAAYIEAFPTGERFILQSLVDEEGEAGVFYVRHPDEAQGRILSLTLKYFPKVVGDGRRSLGELVALDRRAGQLLHLYRYRHAERWDTVPAQGESVRLAFAGSHSTGAIFRDGQSAITPEMVACFDALAQAIPGFYMGRFDVRFARLSDLQSGRGFRIIECNGAGAESTHIWDSRTSLWKAWKDLMRQYHWLFCIGRANRQRGHPAVRLSALKAAWQREKALLGRYPSTD